MHNIVYTFYLYYNHRTNIEYSRTRIKYLNLYYIKSKLLSFIKSILTFSNFEDYPSLS